MTEPTKVIEEFFFKPDDASSAHHATVYFENGNFKRCNYYVSGSYDLKDWLFMYKLSAFVLALVKEKGGESDI